jgi:hypothetical protein
MSHKTASSRADCIEYIWRRLSVVLQKKTPNTSFKEKPLTTSQIGSLNIQTTLTIFLMGRCELSQQV